MHLIPRYEDDDVTIGWKEHSTEDIDMEQLRQDIKKAL
jgi:histidine triad (HIT) family protein